MWHAAKNILARVILAMGWVAIFKILSMLWMNDVTFISYWSSGLAQLSGIVLSIFDFVSPG